MIDDALSPWKILSSEVKYDNPWILVREHQVVNPSGNEGIYGVVEFKNKAIAIIPLDDEGNTWIVGQFRFPMNTYEWEVPEGGSPMHERPEDTAARELLEETGLRANSFTLIGEFQLSNSTTNEVAFAYVARGISVGESDPDEDEVLRVRKIPFRELVELVMDGKIKDCLSVASILKLNALLNSGQL